MFYQIACIYIFRHGGEEGVTCNVIAFDSKSDQGKYKLNKNNVTT